MSTNGRTQDERSCESSCTGVDYWHWDVPKVTLQESATEIKYAVLILNRPIIQHPSFVKKLWKNATVRMTIDGGTRHWDNFVNNNVPEEKRKSFKLPDLITGDFDSVNKETLEKYRQKGCKIIHTPDQNYTDFTKALMELNIHCNAIGEEMDHVIAFDQCSGRIDHILGSIQSLFLARDKSILSPKTRVYLLQDEAISWLLNPGRHSIIIPEDTLKHKKTWCSLVPVGEPCQHVTSTGLKWNLDNQPLQFGQMVSTSNSFSESETVTIKCSHTIFWSMKIPYVMHEQLPVKLK